MELIYTDSENKDLGILLKYNLDLAFGTDENNFELIVDSEDDLLENNSRIYFENTEFGGIVDAKEVDTKNKTVTYSGRSWQGILANKVVEPLSGEDYYTVNGDVGDVLQDLLELTDLTGIFEVSASNADITIQDYSFRYTELYQGILDMLFEFEGKLIIRHSNNKVILSVEYLVDYSKDEEWDSSQFSFVAKNNYRPLNHLVCLGSGNLKDRTVIHLFTDEYGGIQPYSTTDEPFKNSDYILTKENQVMFGKDEICEKYDYSSAENTENYELLSTQPSDWSANYANYFLLEDGVFNNVEDTKQDVYTLLTSQPSAWSTKYSNYYKKVGNNYESVESVSAESYQRMSTKPSDWKKNYKNYYYYYSDGVTEEYKSITSAKKIQYIAQTMQPSDWSTNYTNYYEFKESFLYRYKITTLSSSNAVNVQYVNYTTRQTETKTTRRTVEFVKTISQGKSYTAISSDSAPKWKKKKYYTRYSKDIAPAFVVNNFFNKRITESAPVFATNTYYTLSTNVVIKPRFVPYKYYKQHIDKYAILIENALKKLQESYNSDSINITFDTDYEYDINDIVGATDLKSNISVWQPITKKIVAFTETSKKISYEIGGKS